MTKTSLDHALAGMEEACLWALSFNTAQMSLLIFNSFFSCVAECLFIQANRRGGGLEMVGRGGGGGGVEAGEGWRGGGGGGVEAGEGWSQKRRKCMPLA